MYDDDIYKIMIDCDNFLFTSWEIYIYICALLFAISRWTSYEKCMWDSAVANHTNRLKVPHNERVLLPYYCFHNASRTSITLSRVRSR